MNTSVQGLPRLVADKVGRRCWSVPIDDLRQEAEVVALAAMQHFDASKGDLRGYLYSAVSRALVNYVYEAGTIVSYKHRRALLKDIRSTELKEIASTPDDVQTTTLAVGLWRGQVLQRVTELAGDHAAAILPCLLDSATPMQASKASGLPLSVVLVAVGKAREAISDDETMRQLHEEAP